MQVPVMEMPVNGYRQIDPYEDTERAPLLELVPRIRSSYRQIDPYEDTESGGDLELAAAGTSYRQIDPYEDTERRDRR